MQFAIESARGKCNARFTPEICLRENKNNCTRFPEVPSGQGKTGAVLGPIGLLNIVYDKQQKFLFADTFMAGFTGDSFCGIIN